MRRFIYVKHHNILPGLENCMEEKMMAGFARKMREDIVDMHFMVTKVIFNGPATVVFWLDGTKTIVKCENMDEYSEEEAINQAILKKMFKTNSHHKKMMKDILKNKAVRQKG